MCLRFAFLLITRVITWLWLSPREDTWKTAEILLLRHHVAVLKRHQACRPKLNWEDRALLATLLGVIPNARRHGCWSLCVPKTSSTSCGQARFADRATDASPSSDAVPRKIDQFG